MRTNDTKPHGAKPHGANRRTGDTSAAARQRWPGMHPWFAELIAPAIEGPAADESHPRDRRRARARRVMTVQRRSARRAG